MLAFILFLTLGHVYFDGKVVNPYAGTDDEDDGSNDLHQRWNPYVHRHARLFRNES